MPGGVSLRAFAARHKNKLYAIRKTFISQIIVCTFQNLQMNLYFVLKLTDLSRYSKIFITVRVLNHRLVGHLQPEIFVHLDIKT